MNVYSKLKSEELRAEAIVWMVIGPMMLLFLLFFGIGILLVIPICIVYGLVSFLLFLRTLNTGYMIKSILFLFLLRITKIIRTRTHLINYAIPWAVYMKDFSGRLLKGKNQKY